MNPLPPNGYTILPPGKLANSVTWLDMHAPFPSRRPKPRTGLSLVSIRGAEAARYREIYAVLAHRWLWAGRLQMDPADLARMLDNRDVLAFALVDKGADAGLLELDFRETGVAELAYFGIFDRLIGQGAGAWLLQAAIGEVEKRGVPRFLVHTCNFDHPGALGFYRASGFVPSQTGFEIMDDPRRTGILPVDAAPHVPLL